VAGGARGSKSSTGRPRQEIKQMPPDADYINPPSAAGNIRVDPRWCCPCGTPIKPFDFRIDDGGIVFDCRNCHARLLEIEPASTTKEP
jgi:hypothetical protein